MIQKLAKKKKKKKNPLCIGVKLGMIFQLKRRRIRITSVSRVQRSVAWEFVSRAGKRRYGTYVRDGWVQRFSIRVDGKTKIVEGRTFLQFDGRAWTMPPGYELSG